MSHRLVSLVLAIPWLTLVVYWFVSAIGVKKDVAKKGSYGSSVLLRTVAIVAITLWLSTQAMSPFVARIAAYTDHPPLAQQLVGILLCCAGVAFAIWARVHLGRNWSPVPTLKEGHELITTGPYRLVRNPIYTGLLFALLGSALAYGLLYYVILLVFTVVFVYRVFAEDRLMMQQFPNTYPAYRQKTKALIPYVV